MLEVWLPLLLCIGLVTAWYHALRLHERAVAHAHYLCERHGLQLLDDSVSLHRVRPRWQRGMPQLLREYHFDISLGGNDRKTARFTLLGERIVHSSLPSREPPTADPPATPIRASLPPSQHDAARPDNVISIERARRTLH
jgi:hypothetical protein